MLDPSRPCDSKNRKKNRYTRDELLAMLPRLKNPPFNPTKLTMDLLCDLFKKQKTKSPIIHKTFSPVKSNKCILDPTRPCESKSRKPNRYKKGDLVELWKSHCHLLSKEKPKTIDDYCNVIKNLNEIKIPTPPPPPPVVKHKIPTPPPPLVLKVKTPTPPQINILPEEEARKKIVRFLKKKNKKNKSTTSHFQS